MMPVTGAYTPSMNRRRRDGSRRSRLEIDMESSKLLHLLGTLAIAPVFAISYALHVHADPPGVPVGRVTHGTTMPAISMAKQVGPVARQSRDTPQLRVDDGGYVFTMAGVQTSQSSRTYGNGKKWTGRSGRMNQ